MLNTLRSLREKFIELKNIIIDEETIDNKY